MFCTCQIAGIGFEGKYSIVRGDQMYNYIPAIRNLCRSISSGDSIFYTWTYGLGINTSLMNAYYSYSPFNLFYLLFYNADMNAVTLALVIVKTGLSAVTFQKFVSRSYGIDGIISIIFSIFYSMCSFQVAFNIHNIIWQDAMFILPLVLMYIDRLVEKDKYWGLVVCLSYIFISQFYMGYMIGIASVTYLGVSIYRYNGSMPTSLVKRLKVVYEFFISVIAAAGISAWSWLPALMFLKNNSNASLSSFSKLDANALDVINQFFWGEVSNFDACFPYVYCGAVILILVPLFFKEKGFGNGLRIGYLIAIIFMTVSCVCLPIYALWHGFDDPNSYAFRFSFIFSLYVCVIAAIEFEKVNKSYTKAFIMLLAVLACIFTVEMMWQENRVAERFTSNTLTVGIVNAAILILWFAGICAYNSFGEKRKIVIGIMLIILAMIEVSSNGYVMLRGKGNLGSEFPKDEYDTWKSFEEWATIKLGADEDIFRVSCPQDFNPSSGLYWGFNNVAYFGSAENIKLRNALDKLGIWTSERMVLSHGLTPVTKMLLGVKYDLKNYVLREDGSIGAGIATNDMFLNIVFCADEKILTTHLEEENVFLNNNHLLSDILGEKNNVFIDVPESSIDFVENEIEINEVENGLEIVCGEDASENAYLKIATQNDDEENREYYICIRNQNREYDSKSFILYDEPEDYTNTNGALFATFIKKMKNNGGISSVKIVRSNGSERQLIEGIDVYYLDIELLRKAYEQLCDKQFWVDSYSNGYVRGYVESADGEILLLTVPYEEGWKAKIDGVDAKVIPVIDGAFCAIKMPREGVHEVVLQFEAPGAFWGKMVSCFAVIICICVLLKDRSSRDTIEN